VGHAYFLVVPTITTIVVHDSIYTNKARDQCLEKSNKAISLAALLSHLTYSLLETWKKSGECLMSTSGISSFVRITDTDPIWYQQWYQYFNLSTSASYVGMLSQITRQILHLNIIYIEGIGDNNNNSYVTQFNVLE